jgi:ElaB/YqjD/DUF883 family membrane-anchored ribosome-binding protein
MTTLYEIPPRYRHFYETMMELNDGEVTQDLIQVLDAIDEEFSDKVESCCKMIAEFRSRSESAAQESQRLIGKSRVHANKADRLEQYVKENMQQMGSKTIENGLFRATVCDNPISVNIYDEEEIPEKFYRKRNPVLSKVDIKTAIESGEPVSGAELVRTTGLRIT